MDIPYKKPDQSTERAILAFPSKNGAKPANMQGTVAQRDTEGLASGHSFQVLAFLCSATTRTGCVSSAARSRVLPDDGRVVISAMLVASRESSAMLFEVSPLAFRIKVSIKGVVWVQRIVHLRVNLLWVASEINQFLLKKYET